MNEERVYEVGESVQINHPNISVDARFIIDDCRAIAYYGWVYRVKGDTTWYQQKVLTKDQSLTTK